MEREFRCPSCGAANLVTNPGILMKVCDYCKTAIYWDDESALRAGQKSMDLPESTRFKVGATGKVKGQSFRVLGRLSYAYENGSWNEWFVEMQDGRILWLSEDEGELFLERPLTLTGPVPEHSALKPGMEVSLGNNKTGIVEELGQARCIGGEGEIPFQVEIGEIYAYADGASPDGSFSFGLEYDSTNGPPRAFIGQIIEIKSSRSEQKAAPESRLGQIIRCPSCGKPYEGARVETTAMVVCAACGSGLELDEAKAKVVGKNIGREPKFTFQTGTPLTLEKVKYQVMGRLLYVENKYQSFEYVLHNPDAGYLWLSEEDDHFTLSRPSHVAVAIPPVHKARQKIAVGQETFRFYEQGAQTLQWVDGALPWRAVVGEKTNYTHLVKPPECIDREISGTEVETFRGRYIGHDELKAALPKDFQLPSSRGVYSCQPYVPYSWVKGLRYVGGVFLILNVLLLLYSYSADKNTIMLQEKVTSDQYSKDYLTQPFELKRDGTVLRLSGHAPLDNSWLSMDFAVVDASDSVISEFFGEAGYYHGADSEGHWSEGTSNFASYFKVRKAGRYRLLVHASGGSGINGPSRNEPIFIRVASDSTISWYFIVPILLALLALLIEPMGRFSFESRRWKAVME
ncbi:MAG: DUF4178 domain-containing protein [Desulfomonile tiedjei]|uniref:DUF4178 domain-containing protein n=1 Tax=Desulfomonile tiedjei TaxID=2358 RepID=A0A9D6UX39_9BACT|nr:DUF4178 domain-containing protein [Desulfomonile tiedjei]